MDSLDIKIQDNIAEIKLINEKNSSLTKDKIYQLYNEISNLNIKKDIKTIFISSDSNDIFSSGFQIEDLREITSIPEGKEFFMNFARLLLAIKNSPKIVIANIKGKSKGAAVGLISACDYIFASEDASICLNDLSIGFMPLMSELFISHKIGVHFNYLSLDQKARNANWCLDQGLFSAVYKSDQEYDNLIKEFTSQIIDTDHAAISEFKNILWRDTDHWDQILSERSEICGQLSLNISVRENLVEESK